MNDDTVVTTNLPDLDIGDMEGMTNMEGEDDNITVTLSEIYSKLLIHNELILTIPVEEEATLRKGLATVKAKQNGKIKGVGLLPDPSILSFQVTPGKEAGTINVKILLDKRKGITVLAMKLPDNSI